MLKCWVRLLLHSAHTSLPVPMPKSEETTSPTYDFKYEERRSVYIPLSTESTRPNISLLKGLLSWEGAVFSLEALEFQRFHRPIQEVLPPTRPIQTRRDETSLTPGFRGPHHTKQGLRMTRQHLVPTLNQQQIIFCWYFWTGQLQLFCTYYIILIPNKIGIFNSLFLVSISVCMNTCRRGFGCDGILLHLLWRLLSRTGAHYFMKRSPWRLKTLHSSSPT